jgi:hypothetical protein
MFQALQDKTQIELSREELKKRNISEEISSKENK